MEHPTTPPPTTTASAESRIMTGTTLCSGMESEGKTGERPLYGPSDSKVSPRFSGIRTYARLPLVTGRLEGVDVAIVGIPFDTGGTYRVGARFGPEHIRSASALMRPYHSGSGVPIFDRLSVVDYGDLPVVPGYVEESHGRIAAGLLEVVQAGVIPIDLGGDHSIALPELRALAKVHGKVGLIQLDSHSDTSEEYFGQPHTHGTPFYHAVKEGLVEPSRSIQVGSEVVEVIPAYDVADNTSFVAANIVYEFLALLARAR